MAVEPRNAWIGLSGEIGSSKSFTKPGRTVEASGVRYESR